MFSNMSGTFSSLQYKICGILVKVYATCKSVVCRTKENRSNCLLFNLPVTSIRLYIVVLILMSSRQTQNICITFIQCWTNVETLFQRCINVIQMCCVCCDSAPLISHTWISIWTRFAITAIRARVTS